MTPGDVPFDEMFEFRRGVDPIDAVREGRDDAELRDVAVLMGDLEAAFVATEPLERNRELAALTTAGLPTPAAAPSSRLGPRVAAAAAAFVATLTGKLVLGGAIATAAVGGLHATETVDVPLLPEVGEPSSFELDPRGVDGDQHAPHAGDADPTDRGSEVPAPVDPQGRDTTDRGAESSASTDSSGKDTTDRDDVPEPADPAADARDHRPDTPTASDAGSRESKGHGAKGPEADDRPAEPAEEKADAPESTGAPGSTGADSDSTSARGTTSTGTTNQVSREVP